MNRIFLFLLFPLFFTVALPAFADQSNSSLQVPVVPSSEATGAETHTSYLYDLKKLIEKSRENIKEVNQKIKQQAALKRNQKREERAREYYEKGVELTNEGKLEEARDYFEKAIRITEHPEMAGYIRESQRRLRKQESALQAQEKRHYNQIKQDQNARKQEVEAAYKEAIDLYKQKKYHPAKDAFEHVDEIAPNYRATASYLKIIDQDITTADALAAKRQAAEIQRQQKEAEAARIKEKQMWLAQIEEKEKERKEAIRKQAEEVYTQAVDLYKYKKFAEAKKKFEEVSWVVPDYKATMKYLARIDKDAQREEERIARQQQEALQQQRWEEEVEKKKQEIRRQHELEAKQQQHQKDLQEQAQFLYTAAVNLFNKKDMDRALEKFNDIEKLLPDFRSTRTYRTRIEQWRADQRKRQLDAQRQAQEENLRQKNLENERRRAQELKAKSDGAQAIYTKALQSYRDHRWTESRAQFESVEKIMPDFQGTRRYLSRISRIERTALMADRLKAKHQLAINQERERLRQKKVTEALQREKLKAQEEAREKERQERIKAQAQGKVQQAKAKAEKLAQERKHNKEILHQQEQHVQEKINQEQMMREETQRRHQVERQEQQRQSQLEVLRESVRKQLEDGIETMYQDAMKLYRQGEYSTAAERFKDIQDIIPGYKRTEQYMDEARLKSLKPQKAIAPNVPEEPANPSVAPVAAHASPSASRQDSISKALDLFDSNVQ